MDSVRLHKIGTGRAPRIGIVGAGAGGLTLAAILTRKLPRAQLTVLERHRQSIGETSANAAFGYGLSIDEQGQEALVRAGVFSKFWSISRLRSDLVRTFPLRGAEPLDVAWPRYVEVEVNRAGLHSVLLDALASRSLQVQYDCRVADAQLVDEGTHAAHGDGTPDSHVSHRVELLSESGARLGEPYDLVVDASGLHSPLRSLRIDDPAGAQFTGCSVIHGVLREPEAHVSLAGRAELEERLGEGTCRVVGNGFAMTLQRFGASVSDRRAAFFYWIGTREEERARTLEREMETGASEADGGGLERAKQWLHADMADHFDDVWRSVVDGLSDVTAMAIYTHSADARLRPDPASAGAAASNHGAAAPALPLVCCGESLLSVGLQGGGNLAMRDALELSAPLSAPGAFCRQTGRLSRQTLAALRRVEADSFARKAECAAEFRRFRCAATQRTDGANPQQHGLGDLLVSSEERRTVRRVALNLAGRAWKHVHRLAKWRNGGNELGSDEASLLHPNVAAALAEEQKIEDRWRGVASTIRVMHKALPSAAPRGGN